MNKLFKLRKWLTIADAAAHLTEVFTERITEADLMQLGLEGRLTLSVRFKLPISGREASMAGDRRTTPVNDSVHLTDSFATMHGNVKSFDGIFDLPLIGGETAILRGAEWSGSSEIPDDYWAFDEVMLRSEDGTLFALMEMKKSDHAFVEPFDSPENFNRMYWLPTTEAQLVIRTSALRALQAESFADEKQPLVNDLSTKERNTLLTIIGVLASAARIDIAKASKAGEVIESEAAKLGVQLSRRGVMTHLSRVTEAMAAREK